MNCSIFFTHILLQVINYMLKNILSRNRIQWNQRNKPESFSFFWSLFFFYHFHMSYHLYNIYIALKLHGQNFYKWVMKVFVFTTSQRALFFIYFFSIFYHTLTHWSECIPGSAFHYAELFSQPWCDVIACVKW